MTLLSAVLLTVVCLLSLGVLFLVYFFLRHQKSQLKEEFLHEQTKSKGFLDQNRQAIEHQIGHLNNELSKMVALVREYEKDRDQKFGALDEKLAQTAHATQNLASAAQELNSVIGNNQMRGQWGQRMAEDILNAAGLEEGIHYLKEKTQGAGTRPDYTFLLPNKHKVYMDVKFPLSNYQALVKCEDKKEKERYSNEFLRDVKNRIRELKKRDYINPEEQTLDYMILFIPNEQVFGYIHRTAPDIAEEALAQKILLTSPYSLFGVLSIIRQAFDNFFFNKSTSEILKLIISFLEDYEIFKKRYTDLGDSLDKAKNKYLEVSEKSFKRLDMRIRKLEDFRKGQKKTTLDESEEKTAHFQLHWLRHADTLRIV